MQGTQRAAIGPASSTLHIHRSCASRGARYTCRAVAVRVPEADAIASTSRAVQEVGGYFAPPLLLDNQERMLRQKVPFLTTHAGSLPVKPLNLNQALSRYGSYTSKYVSVRVENVHVKLSSWDHAVESLTEAESAQRPYWCSLIEEVQHPAWWPTSGHVPTYDQVIFGRGNASIGLHFDKDNACAGGSRTQVSTYLAICAGRKLTLLLPPDQTLLPPGGDPELLLRPPPGFLQAVKDAGGYYFMLEDMTGVQSGDSTTTSSSSSYSSDWDSSWRTSSTSTSAAAAITSDSARDWRSNWRSSSSREGYEHAGGKAQQADGTAAGGRFSKYYANSSDSRVINRSSSSEGSHSSTAAAVSSKQSGFSATALYMPSGWYHWLVGLSDWHVVYGGSFYPEQQPFHE